ncbi:alpha/beta hydrolase [Novosphingobium aerophilum]|nr:alpha/beta hydrolase [Novosphingobium aerophilum]
MSETGFDRRAMPRHCQEQVWTAADGWPIRRVDWPVPAAPRGSILFAPGRGDCLEKYLETLEGWWARGWAVTAIDWRGQALSGRLGRDATSGHVEDFAIWVDDLAAFWRQWAATRPGPRVLAAHSMGGHIALRSLAEGRVDPDALVLSAPMLGFLPDWMPRWAFRLAAAIMCTIGDPLRPAWKGNEKPQAGRLERAHLLTHDGARYADELAWREQRPELAMGPATWGWLRAAVASTQRIDRAEVLGRVTTPVFLAATRADALVSPAAILRAARWLPQAELLAFGPEARHELLREIDPIRDRLLQAIDDFLDRVAPARN